MRKLHISPALSLPVDAVTSTIVVYGGKGMGKTNFASVLVEEFAAARLRFAVIDPMGVWWGLRHGADGEGLGIKVLILGGIHGDLPITPESGVLVADLVVDEDANVIIDISRRPDGSMWAISERIRFVRDYAKRIYQRQGERRRPINQVIDEAARFAPQIVRQGESDVAACMGAIAVLVEEGRNVGIGVTLVTQRSARLNKDVAELADCMMAFRIVGPNSMRAVLDWLGEHVDKARLKEIGEKLRSLPRGSALVVSPGWLEFEGIVAMRKRETFDSSKTPEAGKEVRASGAGAKVDLAKYQARMAEVVERAKESDPKALRSRVVDLEKQLAKAQQAVEGGISKSKVVENVVIKEAQLQRIGVLLKQGDAVANRLRDVSVAASQSFMKAVNAAASVGLKLELDLGRLREAITASAPTNREIAAAKFANDGKQSKLVGRHLVRVAAPKVATGERLPPGEAATLRALIQYAGGLERKQLTVITGYKRSSRDAYIQRLRDKGYIETHGDLVQSTQAGQRAMPDAEPLPTGRALQEWWLPKLPEGERVVLQLLLDRYPDPVERDQIDETTGYKRSSRDAYLQRLRAKELVHDLARGMVKASDTLFEVPR